MTSPREQEHPLSGPEKINGNFPIRIDEGSDVCGLEGLEERPNDCPNNPWRHPDNHRPKICRECPSDPKIWEAATVPLNPFYLKTKQGSGEIILPNPKNP